MPSTQLKRAVISSYLGSVIEFYDFLLYATASALVFNKVFFSSLDPVAGTIASFGTFASGYLARPIGGIIFGHFGDRLGRKRMLIITMIMMGVASALIGVLPTYAQIGVWAPVLLVTLRVLQGIALGGEWGGAVLMSAEHATSRRGLWAGFTNAGGPSGQLLSTVAMSSTAAIVGAEAFLSWGWRIPFLLSVVLLGVGLFVRAKVTETPVFMQARPKAGEAAPIVEVFRRHPGNLARAIGVGFAAFVAQATLTTFVIAYAVQAGFERPTVLNALTISSAGAVIGVLAFASLSDRIGRRPVVAAGAIMMAVVAFLLFPLINSGSFVLLTLAVVLGQSIAHPAMFGPLAALYSELFGTRTRYTGASLGYQISATGAGLAPVLFASLSSTFTISLIVAACCLLTVVTIYATRETSREELGVMADR
ncbi:MFS transporter [Nonomuraea soli]|uniref:Putative proline/betaine transporter n=1 Tax=Nonomuraea soli TaxID=1032476 RepID=A0A7W0CI14_9ACTN|nr:MFS transporter [Nonomuraea soli]MBA2891434.1 MFS family permease [Nonomuraea soli]